MALQQIVILSEVSRGFFRQTKSKNLLLEMLVLCQGLSETLHKVGFRRHRPAQVAAQKRNTYRYRQLTIDLGTFVVCRALFGICRMVTSNVRMSLGSTHRDENR
jgi:hypothetical protein